MRRTFPKYACRPVNAPLTGPESIVSNAPVDRGSPLRHQASTRGICRSTTGFHCCHHWLGHVVESALAANSRWKSSVRFFHACEEWEKPRVSTWSRSRTGEKGSPAARDLLVISERLRRQWPAMCGADSTHPRLGWPSLRSSFTSVKTAPAASVTSRSGT